MSFKMCLVVLCVCFVSFFSFCVFGDDGGECDSDGSAFFSISFFAL